MRSYGTQHNPCDAIMTTTTDTPRTDACLNTHSMINHQKWCHKCGGFVDGIYAGNPRSCRCDPKADRIKELEAEVERLKEQYESAAESVARMHEAAVGEIRGPSISVLDDIKAVRERAEKAEAEVKRLKTDLRRSIKIADVLRSGGSRACRELHHSKRDQHEYGEVCPVEERLKKAESELTKLKATLNKKK